MSSRLVALAFDAHDAVALGAFWSSLLGRQVVTEPTGTLLPGDDTQVGLRFVASRTERSGLGRLHLHLTSSSTEDQRSIVAAALSLGGRHLDVGQLQDEEHVVLGDLEGNEFCVIEPGNSFLAGCGLLGEASCDGTRENGVFWRDALQWPLVWDKDEETAIQAPLGGTKISWGGPPLAPKHTRNRQRFGLAAADVPSEVARLVALGATELGKHGAGVELADPDGNEFCIAPE